MHYGVIVELSKRFCMKYISLSIRVLIYCTIFVGASLYGHGFGRHTLVRIGGWWESIEQLFDYPEGERPNVLSYSLKSATCVTSELQSAGESRTSCYFEIGFDNYNSGDMLCTPTQRF